MILTDNEFNRIVVFMKQHYGVELGKKRTLITGRLENKLTHRGYTSYGDFMNQVEKNPRGEDAAFLVNTLTTNHTYFMREPVHFDFMREVALPKIKELAAGTHDLRIWSAAASSGEEAYTIVMTLKDFLGFEAGAWDSKVLATDISTKTLALAKEGIYKADGLRDLPTRWIRQYFRRLPDGDYQVLSEIRNEVIFNTFNLMDPFHWRKKFHIIFLRNVMIYFDEKTKYDLLTKMYDYLEPGGYLIIGTTETIDSMDIGFKHVKPSIYTK